MIKPKVMANARRKMNMALHNDMQWNGVGVRIIGDLFWFTAAV